MILSHIDIQNDKVIIPIEEWDKIIVSLNKIEKVEIEKNSKSWKRKIKKIKIKGNSLSDTIIEERNENIY
ncbi:MAG: hypothetical protein A2086_08710 [Spirochaetes bacterium GWD1_27_9]|nr:MAG: hypothetical protein A2Z98_13080 [Spirochaetes bacterium GWB1_27_13]OHD25003.1 MAG: hypothetical protein A2Y34_13560 [Spirochaetes bacterium GWC1_27_15]OHD40481.1 MAG: hypothetical protein A2086_08710 [Spirochaetes bacterium GWD1_27_9]